MNNRSFSTPSIVARLTEPTPDRPPLAPYSDGLGGNLGELAASKAPSGVDSPSQIEFDEFLDRLRELEHQYGYLPDYFLSSLHRKVISINIPRMIYIAHIP